MENKTNKKNMPIIVVCVLLFLVFFVFQKIIVSNPKLTGITGIVAQLHVMISVILVLTNRKTGFIIGIILNALNFVSGIFSVVVAGQKQAMPSIAISVCTVIIMAIIYNYTVKNDTMHDELMEKYEQEIENKRILQEKDEVLSYLAYYDRLTQMPNRHLFMEHLEERISNKKSGAVVSINLDDFRRINSDFGMSAGDQLIKTYAEKIERITGKNDFCARISGDEFAIILDEKNDNQDIANFTMRIQNIFFEPVKIDDKSIGVSSSIGVALFPKDAVNAEDVLKCSETAMFMCKNNSNKICFFSPIV